MNTLAPLKAAATALAVLAALAAPATASTAAPTAQQTAATLRCQVQTVPGRPITFSPKLTLRTRTVKVSGTFKLTGCAWSDGTSTRLRSGTGTASGTGRASCGGASGIDGSGTITWYDRSGRRVGTSTLKPTLSSVNSYNPGDSLLAGKITGGQLAGFRTAGSVTPTSDVTTCAGRGLGSVHGRGTLRLSR
ncbi:hypothetical protein [Streptomyces acidiscabies]|uniref:Secreted protein n=1 Tax=Streptomyces acidiscabies TaxID=42234 RepID=A0AAP6BES9_9ACTN|nr:hypothetical protein [Streptomyces acidiscabies]MBZ3913579.1 hypothetical protein [Streptomyces acidiscabies]MDX2963417.1 hypothetical protein [Streptomyces acidiscabies]MDX3023151.1 hypothetical protein [Streptomyces acidiscabies]MDX3792705.1 hypothetical protein [Streptomyces acidiscabies]GAQ51350.1 hypothetical protein a10_01130 [Streptomyces acidiscabies]